MNLAKLFEVQKVLRDRINYNEPDRFNKLVLALLVELGECANEWRGFKFWSKDQEPSLLIYRYTNLDGITVELRENPAGRKDDDVFARDFRKPMTVTNPLLEEYVDGLHFVLELGIELEYPEMPFVSFEPCSYTTPVIEDQFLAIHEDVMNLKESVDHQSDDVLLNFDELVSGYVGLGKMLGFTWEEIEEAYMEKNKVNHQRQSEGY